MKKMFLVLATLMTAVAPAVAGPFDSKADCCDSFFYGNIGVGPTLITPSVGIGYRLMNGRQGMDFSMNVSTLFVAHQIQAILAYQFVLNPCSQCPWYAGIGIAPSFVFNNHHDSAFTIAPDIIVGKNIGESECSKQFIELHLQIPTWRSSSHSFYNHVRTCVPMVYVKYGFGF